ncbi:hypothetical protein DEN86_27675 [Escherichia coli]|uniref:Uncharacterized protein n=1 Tax=Escherichia coli TaxID=562 RepID=A0A2A6PZW6_ECOLX|nr:hypothetical protein AW073_27635 [Escherichia coli]OTE52194.1 hypothetical protein AW118_27455 [Escherichia coli]PDV42000.1 hypothetical protein BER14_27565 [Escherichia coli]TFY41582.1 hypothetical protein DEN86_27675 [Escherichia coli]TJQ06220.1 hypothetical protein C9Z68_25965 [Escherichia coli]
MFYISFRNTKCQGNTFREFVIRNFHKYPVLCSLLIIRISVSIIPATTPEFPAQPDDRCRIL